MTETHYQQLRRIAVAMSEAFCDSDDAKNLHRRYQQQSNADPSLSVTECVVQARIGFMAEVLEYPAPWFTCPACGGHCFDVAMNGPDVLFRTCDDEFGKECTWRGSTPNEGMNHATA